MNRELVGLECEPFEMVVELGKVREMARATSSDNSEYLVSAEPVSPPTFLVTAAHWTTAANSPLERAGLAIERSFNGGQEFVFPSGPPRPGARLRGCARVDKVYEKTGARGGALSFMEVVCEYTDTEGRLVAEVRTTYIEASRPPDAG